MLDKIGVGMGEVVRPRGRMVQGLPLSLTLFTFLLRGVLVVRKWNLKGILGIAVVDIVEFMESGKCRKEISGKVELLGEF